MENVHQELVSDHFLILVNKPKQPLHGMIDMRYEKGLL